MKKTFRKNAIKLILGGVVVFVFGIFVGYQLNYNSISSIQGFLFNSLSDASDSNASDSNASDCNASDSNASDSNASDCNASDSNASDCNASDSNASDCNASDSNASDCNASDSNASDCNASGANASMSDNKIFLQSFSLKTASAKPGEKVYVNIATSGSKNNGTSIVFKNNSNQTTFTVSINSISNNPYIIIPTNVKASTYSISDILLVGLNSNNTTFTKHYSILDTSASVTHYDFTDKLNITTASDSPKLTLESFSLVSTEAKVNGKVDIKFNASLALTSLKLKFVSSASKEMVVYAKSLSENPYFDIPSTTEEGTYNLVSATLTSSTSTTIYSKDGSISGSEKFAFNSSIVVKPVGFGNTFVYNNEDLTEEIIKELYIADSASTININADSNPIVSSEVFDAIKGTPKKLIVNYNDNEIVFAGENISSSKTIDLSVNTSIIKSDSSIGKLVNDGILLDFASNGNLPGKAQVRIKITEDMKSKLGDGKIYVYFYNESCDDFSEIATEVTATEDEYYEFDIEHNSEYILVNKALDSKLIAKDPKNVVNFQKSNKVYLLLIGLGVVVIVGVTIGVLFLKKQNQKTPKLKK